MGALEGSGYSRKTETVAALLDDIIIAAAVSATISAALYWAGLIGEIWAAAIPTAATGTAALIALMVYKVHSRRPQVGAEALIGSLGVVVDDVRGEEGGTILVEGELWRAVNPRGEVIGRGEKVRVTGYRGLTLIVERAGEGCYEVT